MSNLAYNTTILSNYSNYNTNTTTSNGIGVLSVEQIIACCFVAFSYGALMYLFISAAHFTWCGLGLTLDLTCPSTNDEIRNEQVLKQLITKAVLPCALNRDTITDKRTLIMEEDKYDDVEIGADVDDENSLNDDHMNCAICLDYFKINDMVAWSGNGNCNHIYHKDCILCWLLKRGDCPYCRCEYINLEKSDCAEKKKREYLKFCYSHGLVSPNQCNPHLK